MAAQKKKSIDDRLLMTLACGATVEVAARTLGISERTVYRRLGEAACCKRLQGLRADMVQRTAGMLTAAAGEGVKRLLALLKGGTPAAVRLGAARAILEIGQLRELAELEERVAALEGKLAADSGGGGNR